MSPFLLHVDDRPDLPDGVAQALRRDGYRLRHTSDPEQVMRLVEERRPALVLMEIEIEGCDGLDLMAGIRDPQFGGVPVLAVTRAERDSAIHGEAIALGVADFLTKPVRAADLLAAIREIVPAPTPDSAAPEAVRVKANLFGDLADTPMPELLARLRRRGANGLLAAGHAGVRVGVQLRNGSPVGVSSSRRHSKRVAEVLLHETFRWEEGRYAFSEGLWLEPDAMLELAGDPGGLLLAGALAASPARQIRERLAKRESLYVCITEDSEAALEAEGVGFTRQQRERIESLGGADTLSVLLESEDFDERLVYALWVGGWLELRTTPTLSLTELLGDTAELELEIELEQELQAPEAAPEPVPDESVLLRDEPELEPDLEPDLGLDLDEPVLAAPEWEEPAPERCDPVQPEPAREEWVSPRDEPELEPDDLGLELDEPVLAAPERAEPALEFRDRVEAALVADASVLPRDEPELEPDDLGLELDKPALAAPERAEPEPELRDRVEVALVADPAVLPRDEPVLAAPELEGPAPERCDPVQPAPEPAPESAPAPELCDPILVVPARKQADGSKAEPAPKRADATQPNLAPAHGEIAPFRAPPPEDHDQLSRSLRELGERLLAGDDFEALGISPSASDEEVRSAYEGILQDVPEIQPTAANLVLAQRAKRIRSRIEAAYANLRDEEKRRAYSLLREEEEQDREAKPSAERALEGERWFRKGKAQLESKRCAAAVEAFGMASHLDPEQGEYVSHLGYALYLLNPKDEVVQREAMEHLACGIKLSPKHELSYVYLGRILKAKGDIEVAKKIFQKALQIKPDFHPAVQELRVLEMRERKGILRRLLGR